MNYARVARCVVGVVGIMLCATANSVWAITCTITAQGVVFGNYDVFNAANLDGTGNVAITCDLISAYSVALSPGTGTFAVRKMASGSNRLNYNLYTDPTRTTIWGDGTSGTSVISGATLLGTTANRAIYGRIPAQQNLPVGNYIDNITVTLTF